ncbi:hypothetical protein L2E82_47405 [Cichorium intybus]|uniref:Uncharacterized protein n=1 Tax=Cichorium intybus TaxID=13427 RepID=A0ACB8YWG7_CICIN|nr:hypothetical protein L2E82_47405 [Cichorium intybus]
MKICMAIEEKEERKHGKPLPSATTALGMPSGGSGVYRYTVALPLSLLNLWVLSTVCESSAPIHAVRGEIRGSGGVVCDQLLTMGCVILRIVHNRIDVLLG